MVNQLPNKDFICRTDWYSMCVLCVEMTPFGKRYLKVKMGTETIRGDPNVKIRLPRKIHIWSVNKVLRFTDKR